MTINKYLVRVSFNRKGVKTMMKKQNPWFLAVLCSALAAGSFLAPLERLSAAPAQEKTTVQASVNVNKANASELESVKGIGPLLAKRIIEYREANGRFEHLEDLIRVPGIGQAKLERIKDQITL